jgi:heme a synthase
MASFVPGLRRAGSKLSLDFFICHQCQVKALAPRSAKWAAKSTPLRNIRFNSTSIPLSQASGALPTPATASPLTSLSQTISNGERAAGKKFFPETSSRSVAYWLLGSAASVFGIVVFGGLTRLTESGYANFLPLLFSY